MPTRLVQHHQRMNAAPQMAGKVMQVRLHRLPIGPRENAAMRLARRRADRTEQVSPFVFRLAPGARPTPPLRPNASQGALLTEARLVLEPDFDFSSRVTRLDGVEGLGQLFF